MATHILNMNVYRELRSRGAKVKGQRAKFIKKLLLLVEVIRLRLRLWNLHSRSLAGNKKISLLVFLHPDAKNKGYNLVWEIFKRVNVVSIIFLFKIMSRVACE